MEQSPNSRAEAVAIIGMSGRFPGAASLDGFWQNLAQGVDSISTFRPDELEYSQAERDPANAANYVRARSIITGEDLFDAAFFGYYPKQAEVMDPQHRVFLECAWEALESAGYNAESYPGLIGLYAGLSLNTYLLYNLCSKPEFAAAFAAAYPGAYDTLFGNDKDFLTTRVAHKLNLRGPCVTVQTACSTSLVAVVHAYYSLVTYQCDMALAGGVSITFPQRRDYLYQPDGMVSRDGTCRTFDAEASGTVFGSGAGLVVLKRLSDALAEGDHICAVIIGGAMNNDGSSRVGYAAPGVDGQAAVIALAHDVAGISPDSISYIEAHGTATPLGDPIEVAALTQAFRRRTARKGFCGIGSAKTNVGHLDMAAGVTGLIKAVLGLQHQQIPPLVHFQRPNPRINFAESPFYPVAKLTHWPRGENPRRAGVSAFGVGGTNAHVVLEEAPSGAEPAASRSLQLLCLSARTETALDQATRNLAQHLKTKSADPLPDVSYTLQVGRKAFSHRRVLIAKEATDAVSNLEALSNNFVFSGSVGQHEPPVVFLFPGQGAQYVEMGRVLYEKENIFRDEVSRCAELLRAPLGLDIREVLYPAPEARPEAEKKINQTSLTQPAIFVIEYALAKLWQAWGIKPTALLGHSIGEYVCAVLAGTFTLADALALLSLRAKLMQALPPGSMLAVRLAASQLELLLPKGVSVAAFNSPRLTTVSGPTELLGQLQKDLEQNGIAARFLATSHAFHSEMMEPMLPEFVEAVRKVTRSKPTLRWISTCTGKPFTPEDVLDPGYWARQLRQPVRFTEALEAVLVEQATVVLEVGPGQTLSQLARQHPSKAPGQLVLSSLPANAEPEGELYSMLTCLGRLWVGGAKPDWNGFYAFEKRARVPLPTYPFERKRFWVEPAKGDASANTLSAAPTRQSQPPAPTAQPSAAAMPNPNIEASHMISNQTAQVAGGRREALSAALRATIKELSGIEVTDGQASFMELGFDSLFLTQASQALQSKFGVNITFRQMLGELSSVDALAEYLCNNLSESALGVSPLPPPSVIPPVVPLGQFQGPAGAAVEQLIAVQMQTIQALLAQQRAQTPVTANNSQAGSLPIVKWPNATPPSSQAAGVGQEFKRFGPYKPIEKGEKGGLTSRQQKALDDLIKRYVAKTVGSKAYTSEHRPHFADPRAVAGFKSNWKEMVYPIVASRSKGSKIWDVDGNEYVDITMGFGTYFFGHSPDWILEALEEQIRTGIEIGPQNLLAGKVARLITEFTGLDRVTFCNTGSEAVMAAIRLARTVTGRKRVVYFTGDYHGMFEEVLVRGSWVNGEYRAQPIAPGIPASLVENMLVLEYGAPESIDLLKTHGSEIAAVIVEPVQSRQPGVQPRDFIHQLRAITERCGTALIFDEVVTGFRCHPGGAQGYFGVRADMATYGKVIGGGMPIGVLAGTRKFMDALDGGMWHYGDDSFPEVGVTFFAGTFVRHPLAMAAAWRVLNYLKAEGPGLQLRMAERVERLSRSLNEHFAEIQVPIRLPSFSAFAMIEYAHDLKYASLLSYYLREKGIHVWEGRPCFFTLAHSDEDFDAVVHAFKESVAEMQEGGFLPESPAGKEHLGIPTTTATSAFPRYDTAATTEAQREIFFSVQMGDDANCAYNESIVVHFDGVLDVAALENAALQLIERHPALRSTFSADGQRQMFFPAVNKLVLPILDLSNSKFIDSESELKRVCAAEQSRPFDLFKGPLVRMQLAKLDSTRHAFIFTAHHLVCDGWSIGMVVAEICAIYNALKTNRIPLLPPPMSFADYARLLAREKNSAEADAAQKFWVSQFSDGAPTLELPVDRPRPALKTFSGAMESRVLDPTRLQRLKKATPQLGGTVFATLLSAFATLLYRLSGQDDLVIGVPAAGQTMVGCNELVGHCLNFLPLRLRFQGAMDFASFAKSVKSSVLTAYEHQDFTYGTLIQKLKLPRDTSRLPLVSVMFNIDKAGFDLLKFEGLSFKVHTNPKRFVNFDLFFNLVQGENSLEVECEYNTDLFQRDTILRWLEMFEALIENIIQSSETSLAELDVLGPSNRERLLNEFNRTAREYPRDRTIHSLFEEQARIHPGKVALRFSDSSLTYAELDQAANRIAAQLKHQGVAKGALVGLCAERSLEQVICLLGILKAGAAYVPMDPAFPAERLGLMVEDSRMSVILTHSNIGSKLPANGAQIVSYNAQLPNLAEVALPTSSASDAAYVIYTSGSTGRPKGVEVTHRSVVNLLNSMRREPGLDEGDVLLSVTTLSFDIAGLELFLPLTSGATVVIATREALSDGNLLKSELESNGATVMQATPSTWRLLLDAGWPGNPNLKILIGGEAVPRDLVNLLVPRCASVWNVYGPTETTIWSTTGRLLKDNGSVSIGRPIDNTTVYIVNCAMQLQPVGVPGELLIGGEGVAVGYYRQPELSASRFITDKFSSSTGARAYRTGDLAKWRPDGTIECLGRLDDQVKIRGFRIELGEIEAVLAVNPGVKENVVVAREDAPGIKRLVVYFTAAVLPAPSASELRAHLLTRLPDYMVPAFFVCLDALPLTPNGKISRRSLPAPQELMERSAKTSRLAQTKSEKSLTEIWQGVLRRTGIGIDDDVFELGGDSILVFQITSRANEAGLPLTPAQVFRQRTIANLVKLLDAQGGNVTPATSPRPIGRVDRSAFRSQ